MALRFRFAATSTLFALLLHAQTPLREVSIRTHTYTPPSTILRAESNLVETALVVRDSSGRALAGLHATDFQVLDNGVPQKISAFSEMRADGNLAVPVPASQKPAGTMPPADAPPAAPKFVTFFFDDFHTGLEMAFVKQAARAFIAKGLKPADRMSIVTASGQGDLEFTGDAKLFAEKIEHLSSHSRQMAAAPCGVSPIDSYIVVHRLDGRILEAAIAAATPCAGCAGDTADCRSKALPIADQLARSAWEQLQALSLDTVSALGFATKKLAKVNGSRILVLTSSGFLMQPGVQPEMQSLIDAAVHWNIVIHAIAAQGLDASQPAWFSPRDGLRRSLALMPLQNIAEGTGGHYFKDSNDLAGEMELATNPEVSYLLAFNPGSPDGKFHTLKIKFRGQRADSIQFRPGYFSPDPKKQQNARAPLDDAVLSAKSLNDVAAVVAVAAGEGKDGAFPVAIAVTLDLNRLQFTKFEGRHMQQIVFLMTLLDANGEFVTGKESIMDLALTDDKLASLKRDGLKAVATLNAPAGRYQVRTVVREGMKGSLSTSTSQVDLGAR